MGWLNPFGGQPQNPSQVSLLDLALTSNVALFWPWSGEQLDQVQAKIIRVTSDVDNRNIDMADATQASPGEATIFINVGSHTFNVNDSTGANVATVAAGTAKYLYLFDNSTAGGSWGVFTFGAGTSGADASALAGAGLIALSGTLNEALSVTDFSATGLNLTSSSRAILYNWTSGAGAITTDDPATLGTSWFAMVKNSGSGTLTLTPAAGTIDGGASKAFAPGDAAFIVADGGNLLSLGFGQSAAFAFDYIAINVAGTGTFTLNTSQQNRIAYNLTGLLTGTRTIVVPATLQQYWVTNATTGAFNLYVKTAAQAAPGIQVDAASANILYCDGSNVRAGVSATGVSLPVSIANGGTGATTASGARTNLGSTTVGDALFTAASAAAAASAIGAAVTNANNNFTADQTLVSTDAGATAGPVVTLDRNSASPAVSDFVGEILFKGRTSTAATVSYGTIYTQIDNATNATAAASMYFVPLNISSGYFKVTCSQDGATLYENDPSSSYGPTLTLMRDSASPAAADDLAQIWFSGKTSTNAVAIYGKITASIVSATNASYAGYLSLWSASAAGTSERFRVATGLYAPGATGGDKGVGTVNATGLYINGTAVSVGTRVYGSYTTNADLSTVLPADDTIPTSTEGTQVISISVVTTSATQRTRLSFSGFGSTNATTYLSAALYQGSTCIQAAATYYPIDTWPNPLPIVLPAIEVVVGSATTTTFSVRVGAASGAARLNGNGNARLFGGVAAATLVADTWEP